MIDLALKNLWNKKTRTILSIVAVTTAITLYIGLNTMVESQRVLLEEFSEPFKDKLIVLEGGKSTLSPTDYMIGLRSTIDNNTVTELLSNTQVTTHLQTYEMCYISELFEGGYAPSVYLMGISNITNSYNYFFNDELPTEALNLDLNEAVLIGEVAAEYLGVTSNQIGQTVTINSTSGISVNITIGMIITQKHTENLLALFSVITSINFAQNAFLDWGYVSFLVIDASDDVKTLENAIETNFKWRLDAVTPEEYVSMINFNTEQSLIFFNAISYMTLLISIVMIMSSSFTAVRERRKEIATIRACGAPRWWIILLILSESLITSALSGVLGIFVSFIFTMLLLGTTEVFMLSVAINGFILGLLLGPIGAMLPAIRAAREDPLKGLTYE